VINHQGARLRALLGGVAAMALAQAAHAQQAKPADSVSVEEIVVTATRSSELLKDVAMSVDVATGEQIKKLNIFDFKDVAQLAPGLVLSNNDGRSNTATLRGIAFDPDSGAAPAVDTYFNEMPIDAQVAFSAVYDVGQIEVLRGPQGLLRGRTSPAGAITLTTKPASLNSFEGYAQATLSDRSARNLQGAVSVPLVEGKLALRLSGLSDRNDLNQVRNVTRGDKSKSRTKSGRLTIAAQPTDTLSINLVYQHLEATNDQYPQVVGSGARLAAGPLPSASLIPNGPSATIRDRISVVDGVERFKSRADTLTLQGSLDLGWSNLSLNLGRQKAKLDQSRDQDIGNAIPNYADQQHVVAPYDTYNYELRLNSKGEGRLNYMVGANLYRVWSPTTVSQPRDQFITAVPAALLGLPPALGTISTFPLYTLSPVSVGIEIPNRAKTKSVFGSVSYDLTDRLKIEAGLRYTHYHTLAQSYLTVTAAGTTVLKNFATLPQVDADKTYSATTGGANISYKLSDDLTTYVSYGRSFRGGVAAVGNTAPLEPSLVVTRPEKSDAIEWGIKGDLFDRKVSIGADIFYQKFDGYIARTAEGINTASGRNGLIDSTLNLNYNGDAVAKGVEVQVSARPVYNWDLSASASYTDAHFKNVRRPCNTYTNSGAPVVPTGQQVNFCNTDGKIAEAAPFSATLSSEYRFAGGRFEPFIRGLFTYSPGFDSDVVAYHYDDMPIMNLFAGVRGPGGAWDLTVFARNLFNVERIRSIAGQTAQRQTSTLNSDFSMSAGPSFESGYRGLILNSPREVGVTLRTNF
jgi:iron complex outermembrane receptor protein